MKTLHIIILSIAALLPASCGTGAERHNESSTTAHAPAEVEETTTEELPLPQVPDTLLLPTDRAAYLVTHFWEAMDFGDTLKSRDEAFMEQNFANYANLLPYVDEATARSSVERLMEKASADRSAYNLLADIADKYLYDPNSPMMDEEAYILFLNAITGSRFMDSDRKVRFESQLKDALKNRRGEKASDFSFVDRNGNSNSLYGTADGRSYRLLMFYDPDCAGCEHAKAMLSGNTAINDAIADGRLKVVAVYSDGDNEVWEKSKNKIPGNWISACSPDGAVDRDEVYVIRATPTLYLLAPDNTVLLKDAQAGEIIQALSVN